MAALSYDARKLYCFWEPGVIDAVTEQELRALNVGYRARSIKRVTAAFLTPELR
jgi:3-methyladenine DNA glycosylase/8-oxoguanine DNA glycosylase